MRLKSLGLTNFRGFDRLDIKFDDRLTVIAGVNGAGKSTILQAIAIAFSHALLEFTVSHEKPLPIIASDIQQGKTSCIIEMENTTISEARLLLLLSKESLDSNEKLALGHNRRILNKELLKLEKSTPDYKNIKNEISWIDKRLEGEFEKRLNWLFTDTHESDARLKRHLKSSPNQPLAIYYSTKRFLSRLPPSLRGTLPSKQAAAFTKALTQPEVSLNDFAKWHRALLSLRAARRDTQHGAKILRLLQDAITGLIPEIKEFWFHEENPPRYSVMKYATVHEQLNDGKAGKALFLEQLSDGERGLLALVFDLTRRLAIANPASDNPIAEGVALVLIDEIELHLHPKWQRDVLSHLTDTFKGCQFVVTTHSPQVIGEVDAQCVRLLSLKNGKIVSEIPGMAYGADSNWILNVLMGADEMSENVEGSLEDIARSISDRNMVDAKEKLAKLRARVGNTSALQKTASIIERIERLGR